MKPLPTLVLATGLAAAAGAASALPPAPQFGTVVSSTPVTVQVTVPRQQCENVRAYVQPPTSGGGAVVGGVLGGLAGNAIGAGAGRAIATGVGAIAGAAAGNGVEAANTAPVPVTTTNCVSSRSTESRVIGYDVVYEFNGQRYQTRTTRDPGARIALEVRPVGEMPVDRGQVVTSTAPVASYPATPAYPAYPVAAYPAYPDPLYVYPPFGYGSGYYGYGIPVYGSISIGGRIGGGHGHWR